MWGGEFRFIVFGYFWVVNIFIVVVLVVDRSYLFEGNGRRVGKKLWGVGFEFF